MNNILGGMCMIESLLNRFRLRKRCLSIFPNMRRQKHIKRKDKNHERRKDEICHGTSKNFNVY